MVNNVIDLSVILPDEKSKKMTLGFSSKSKPDILVNSSSNNDYSPSEATVKEGLPAVQVPDRDIVPS